MIQVYHLSANRATRDQRLDAMLGYNPAEHVKHCAVLWALGMYDHVASVETDMVATSGPEAELELAWRLTNSVDSPWYAGNGLRVTNRFTGKGCRSSCVGDVFVLGSGPGAAGARLYVAASFGFTEFTHMLRAPQVVCCSGTEPAPEVFEFSVPALGAEKITTGPDGTEVRWEDGAQSLQIHGFAPGEDGMFVRLMSWATAEERPGMERDATRWHPELAKFLGRRVRVTVEVLP